MAEIPGEGTYVCNLNDDTMKKARKELCEDEKDRASKIQAVREWIKTHPYITSRTDDEFILRFLRVSKFRVMEAQQRIEKFCISRTSSLEGYPEWFRNQDVDDPAVRNMLDRGVQCVLPRPKDQPEGPVYVLGRADQDTASGFGMRVTEHQLLVETLRRIRDVVTTEEEINTMMKVAFMCGDTNMMDPNVQIHGVYYIQDMEHFSLEIMRMWGNENMKKSIKAWQDVYPLKMKQFNFINMPSFFNLIMDVVKMFLKKKYQERMYFHKSVKCLHKKIPKECLPEEYGGTAGKLKDLIDAYRDRVLSNMEEYKLLKECWVNEEKMPRQIPEGDCWGMVGCYRKLEA